MNNERKESEQSGHGPIKDASLECMWSEWKNEINENIQFPGQDAKQRSQLHELIVGYLIAETVWSRIRWHDIHIWWNGKDIGNGHVLFNIAFTPCVWRDKMKSQNLLSMTNISIHYLSDTSYAAESTCLVLTCYYYRFLTRNF